MNIAFYLFDKSFQFFENKLGRREKPTAKKELKFLGKLHRVRNLNYERKFPQGKRDDPKPNWQNSSEFKKIQIIFTFEKWLTEYSTWFNIGQLLIYGELLKGEESNN